MTQPPENAPQPQPATPANDAPSVQPVAATPVATQEPISEAPRPKIRWLRLFLVAVPIAGVLLLAWYWSKHSTLAKQSEQTRNADEFLKKYPMQPEKSFGYWRNILGDSKSSESMRVDARQRIQELIEQRHLFDRYTDLIGDLMRTGETDMIQSQAYAQTMAWLDANFKTPETTQDGERRIARIVAIKKGYADAMNDKQARAQYDKAIEKLLALYDHYPEAQFLRPQIAQMESEVADAMISLDALEDARDRLKKAYELDPQPLYRDKMNMVIGDITRLDPTELLKAAKNDEDEARRDEAKEKYEQALRQRRSNKQAAEGYSRILKYYAEIFLKNAIDDNGELTDEGVKFTELAEKNAKLIAQYSDEQMVLARAESLLAQSHFAEHEYTEAKALADIALNCIPEQQRTSQEGSLLMAKIFKLYYHLAKNDDKIEQSHVALQLADSYCRIALDKHNPRATKIFNLVQNLERLERQDAIDLESSLQVVPPDTTPTGDVRNIVNDGPLSRGVPIDTLGGDEAPHLRLSEPPQAPQPDLAPAPTGAPTPRPAVPGMPTSPLDELKPPTPKSK